MVSIKDVAEAAGVSHQTASSVLTGKARERRIGPGTEQRVRAAAASLGYRPNAASRAMRRGRLGTLAFLRTEFAQRGWYSREFLDGFESAAEERGLRVELARVDTSRLLDGRRLPMALRELSADGVLMNCIVPPPPELRELLVRMAIPAIWTNIDYPYNTIRPDDAAATADATRRVLALGHRRLVFFSQRGLETDPQTHYAASLRRRVVETVAGEAAATVRVITGERSGDRDGRSVDAAAAFLGNNDATAVLCPGSPEALAVILAAQALRIRVPEDLSVVTLGHVDDLDIPQALTGVGIPFELMGRKAVDMLERKIKSPRRTFAPELIPCNWFEGETLSVATSGHGATTSNKQRGGPR